MAARNTHNLTDEDSLMDGDLGGDLGPEASIPYRHHGLLWVTVHMQVQHETAEGGSEVVGQAVVKHAAQDQIHRELTSDLVDGEVLTVQTHFSKEVQLIPTEEAKDLFLCFCFLGGEHALLLRLFS